VLDASALAAVLFLEPTAESIADKLRDVTLVAPHLLGYEIANVCLKKMRSSPDRRAGILLQFAAWDQFGIELLDVDHHSLPELAEQFGLSSYDASYLWLTQQLDAELVTLDERLARAAGSPGLG
jgi:predicted nucleic acid-binding protein